MLYLKRPTSLEPEHEEKYLKYRLDQVLLSLAKRGVKIYILLFKEIEMALPLKSAYAKKTLLDLDTTNIYVLRHPLTFISLWSHHEKLVVIDQQIAFVGGLDLCFGRFDRGDHPIVDKP